MAFWSKKKLEDLPWKMWELPGEIGTVSLPAPLSVEMEQDNTLLAWPGGDSISLRFSSISMSKKGKDGGDVAKQYLRNQAQEENLLFYEVGDKGVQCFEEKAEHEGQPLLINYWYVGSKSTVVIVSATIVTAKLADSDVKELLDLMPRIIESIDIKKTHKIASYEGCEVPITEETVEQVEQKIVPFGPSENAWLEDNRHKAASLGVKYGSGGSLSPEELDIVLSRWTGEDGDRESSEIVASALGAAFGDYLVENHGFRWVVVTDQFGTDYAVRHPVAELLAFPASSVSKRIEANESECFQALRAAIMDVLQRNWGDS